MDNKYLQTLKMFSDYENVKLKLSMRYHNIPTKMDQIKNSSMNSC
jgi:hypothetical protein